MTELESNTEKQLATDDNLNSSPEKTFFHRYSKVLLLWVVIIVGILFMLYLGVDKKIIAFVTLFVGIFTQAFAGLAALVSLLPIVGPLIVKLFTIPFFWLLNGLGYFVSVVAIKKGYSKDVAKSRVLTITLLMGIIIGYILGHLLPIR